MSLRRTHFFRAISILAASSMVASTGYHYIVSAGEVLDKSLISSEVEGEGNLADESKQNTVIYLGGEFSNNKHSGLTQEDAVKTFKMARKLVGEQGVIYICGTIEIKDTRTWELPDGVVIRRAEGFEGPLVRVSGFLTLKNILMFEDDIELVEGGTVEGAVERQIVYVPEQIEMDEPVSLSEIYLNHFWGCGEGDFVWADKAFVPTEYESVCDILYYPFGYVEEATDADDQENEKSDEADVENDSATDEKSDKTTDESVAEDTSESETKTDKIGSILKNFKAKERKEERKELESEKEDVKSDDEKETVSEEDNSEEFNFEDIVWEEVDGWDEEKGAVVRQVTIVVKSLEENDGVGMEDSEEDSEKNTEENSEQNLEETPDVTPEVNPENTPAVTPMPEPTWGVIPTPTVTPIVIPIPTVMPTPTVALTPEATPTEEPTPEVTPTVTPTPEATPTVTPTPEATPTVTPTPEATPTVTPTPEATPTVTPTPEVMPTVTPTPTEEPTPEATPTVTPTPEVMPTVTPAVVPTPDVTPGDGTEVTPEPEVTPTVTPAVTPEPEVPALTDEQLQEVEEVQNLLDYLPGEIKEAETAEAVIDATKAYDALNAEQKALLGQSYADKLFAAQEAAKVVFRSANNVTIEGDFPWYVQVQVAILSDPDTSVLEDSNLETIITPYDICLYDLMEDTEYDLNGQQVKVTVPAPDASLYEGLMIIHYEDDGSVEYIEPTYNEDGTISFITDSFSPYSIAGNTVLVGNTDKLYGDNSDKNNSDKNNSDKNNSDKNNSNTNDSNKDNSNTSDSNKNNSDKNNSDKNDSNKNDSNKDNTNTNKPITGNNTSDNKDTDSENTRVPDTGDNSPFVVYVIIIVVAAAVIIVAAWQMKKKK